MRPPGYEPGELPTAPLRDVFTNFFVIGLVLFCDCKGTYFFANHQIFFEFFLFSPRIALFMSVYIDKSDSRMLGRDVLSVPQRKIFRRQ